MSIIIIHPELGEAEVVASALPVWLKRGWSTLAQEVSAPTPGDQATPENYAHVATSDVTSA